VIHLDTTCAVDLLREARKGENGAATRFLSSVQSETVVIGLFVQSELFLGAELSQRADKAKEELRRLWPRFRIAYPDQRFPEVYGALSSTLRRQGQMVGIMDVLIATLALVDGAPVVTRNVKDFARIPNLRVLPY
jgi:tRNA(fMet)-specific endonuclease VapC